MASAAAGRESPQPVEGHPAPSAPEHALRAGASEALAKLIQAHQQGAPPASSKLNSAS